MFRLMKNEWKKIWIPVLLTLIVVTVAACTMTATMYPDYSLTYTLDAWEVGTEYLSLLYPLFLMMFSLRYPLYPLPYPLLLMQHPPNRGFLSVSLC